MSAATKRRWPTLPGMEHPHDPGAYGGDVQSHSVQFLGPAFFLGSAQSANTLP